MVLALWGIRCTAAGPCLPSCLPLARPWPFSSRALRPSRRNSAKTSAIPREIRYCSHGHVNQQLRCGPLGYDGLSRTFILDGSPLALAPRERAVLEVLILRDGRAVNKEALRMAGQSGFIEA